MSKPALCILINLVALSCKQEPPRAAVKSQPATESEPVDMAQPTTAPAPTHSPASPCVESRFAWKPSPDDGGRLLSHGDDFDGDAVNDRIKGVDRSGSGAGTTTIELSLSTLKKPVAIEWEYSFASLVHSVALPPEIAGNREIATVVAEALAGHRCAAADPSLFRALAPSGKTSVWHPGPFDPKKIPRVYSLVEPGDRRVFVYSYLNHLRCETGKLCDEQPTKRATRDSLELWTTAHGGYLVDTARKRYLWLFTNQGQGERKLRFPSVTGARFEGDEAVFETLSDPGGTKGFVRVALPSGDHSSSDGQ